jgi:hypothetical protein
MTKRSNASFICKPTPLVFAALIGLCFFSVARTQTTTSAPAFPPDAGRPLIKVLDSQTPNFTFTGSARAVAALRSGTANPTALAAADFDADGAMDVVAGYATELDPLFETTG